MSKWFVVDMDGINLFYGNEFIELPYDNEISYMDNFRAGIMLARTMNEIEKDLTEGDE